MKKIWVCIGAVVLINIIFRVICRLSADFSEWYAVCVYPFFVKTIGFVSGLFPFSLIEMLIYLLIIAIPVVIIFYVIHSVKHKKRFILRLITALVCFLCIGSTSFLFFCEINYQRYPFSKYSGLTVSQYSAEDLRAVIDEINLKLTAICSDIQTDDNGRFSFDDSKLFSLSQESMTYLSKEYTCLDTYYPRPKPIFMSELILSKSLLCGVYSPFTIEANYNGHMPDSEKPFTVCHELSHMNGFMREDEANFIAFLACRAIGDNDFLYSGYTRALVYCINVYYAVVDEETYFDMFREIPLQVRRELELTNEYWEPYRYTVISDISQTVNDIYLKVNSQSDGRKSYGRFVDLLIAQYKARNP